MLPPGESQQCTSGSATEICSALGEHFKRHVMLIIGINCWVREKLNEYPAQGRPDAAIVQPDLPIRNPVCPSEGRSVSASSVGCDFPRSLSLRDGDVNEQ